MRLWQVRRHWDELARADPLWAVLTEAGKDGQRWTEEEFFSTGVAEVAADLARVRVMVPGFSGRHALDFGCGAGRLTQALAAHFDRVTGVDISGRMVALAQGHSRNERVTFAQNRRPDLRAFASGSFDFVYSRITLQHLAPRYSKRYLREFVRILAPGGILFVQIPAGVPPGDPPERFRLSLWPPTFWMRLRRYIRYHNPGWFPGTPKMQMYALGREEVAGCLAAAGAAVLAVERGANEGFEDLCYIGRKPVQSALRRVP
jgi:SAM-dependent methyltransferase